jgi:hypothetical protein
MKSFTLEELKETVKAFSTVQSDFLAENCIIALEANNHRSGCVLRVNGDAEIEFTLAWSKQVSRAGYQEPVKFTEKAAEAVSFFLTAHLTEYVIVEESVIGTGIDYWLDYAEYDARYNKEYMFQAKLEISGIFRETKDNTLENRVKDKKRQVRDGHTAVVPAYISVVEFSSPKAFFGKL